MEDENIVIVGDRKTSQYVISLDSIDLSLIPLQNYQRKEETVPLWTTPSSDPVTEYFKFEVLATEYDSDDEDCVSLHSHAASDDDRATPHDYLLHAGDDKLAGGENASSELCPLCETRVPLAHRALHAASAPHRACANIAEIALDRARRQMSLSTTAAAATRDSTYYCSPCSISVSVVKRKSHEESETHRRSVLYEKLIQSLASLYKDRNNLDKVCEELFGKSVKNHVEKDLGNVIENDDEMKGEVEQQTAQPLDSMNSESDSNSVTHVKVFPKSGAQLSVSFDNYNGFYSIGDKTQCRVCRVMVDNKYEHESDGEHKRNTDRAVADKHCIRQLDHILNHCILCNEIIENIEAHILCSDNHNSLLKDALIEDDKIQNSEDEYTKEVLAKNYIQKTEYNDANYYCNICHIYLMKSTLTEHIDKLGHKNTLASLKPYEKNKLRNLTKPAGPSVVYCSVCNIHITEGKKAENRHKASQDHLYKVWVSEKDTKIHYHMKRNGREVVCKICEVYVSDNLDTINEHVDSLDHQIRYKKMLKENHMKKVGDKNVLCTLCNINVLMIHELSHIITKKHRKNIKKLLGSVGLKQIKTNYPVNVRTRAYDELLKTNQIEDHSDIYYHCKICYIFVIKSTIHNHINSKKHIEYFDQVNKTIIANQNVSLDKESTYKQTEETKDTICLNNHYNLAKDVKKSLEDDEIARKGKMYYCEVCKVHIENACEKIHVKLPNHVINLAKLKSLTAKGVLNINQQQQSDINASNVQTIEAHSADTIDYLRQRKPPKKLHYLFALEFSDGEAVRCLACNLDVAFAEILLHRKDKRHKETYKNLLHENTMFRIRHRCFCECCRVIMKVNQEYIHLTSESHHGNLIHNTKRMDKATLQEISMKMFNEDIAAEKRAKREVKHSRTILDDDDSSDCGEHRFDDLRDLWFFNSSVNIHKKCDDEDNSISDSNYSFVSANSCVDISEEGHIEEEVTESQESAKEELINSFAHLFENTDNCNELLCRLCHCVLPSCSDLIREHVDGVKHARNYEETLLFNNLKEIVDKGTETIQKYRCGACGEDVEKSQLFVHVNDFKHKIYLTVQPSTSGVQQNAETRKDAEDEENKFKQDIKGKTSPDYFKSNRDNDSYLLPHKTYLMEHLDSKELYCKICDSELINSSFNSHVMCQTHQTKFESLLLENEVKKVGAKMFCALCNIVLIEGAELSHIYENEHKANLKKFSLHTNTIAKPNAGYVCTTCNIIILNNPNIIKLHTESIRHKNNLLKSKKGSEIKKDNTNEIKSTTSLIQSIGQYFCKVCNVEVPNNPYNIKTHNDGNRHKANLNHTDKQMIQKQIKENLQSLSHITNPITNSIPSTSKSTTINNKSVSCIDDGFCKVCKVDVPKNILNIREHSKGQFPTKNEQLLKTNSKNAGPPAVAIETANNIENGFCNVCKVKVTDNIANITQRIQGQMHTDNLNTIKTSVSSIVAPPINNKTDNYVENGFCNVCKVKVPNNISNIRDHLKGKFHNENVQRLKTNSPSVGTSAVGNENTNNINNGFCKVCKVKVTDNIANVTQHIQGQMHKDNLNTIKSSVSSVVAPSMNGKTENYVENGFCKVCKVKVPNNISNIRDHLKGKLHTENVPRLKTNSPSVGTSAVGNENTNNINNGFCKVCKVKVTDNIANVTQHIQGQMHKDNLNTIKSSVSSVVAPSMNSKTENYVENGFCKVCKAKVPNDIDNIRDHLKGKFHNENVQRLKTNSPSVGISAFAIEIANNINNGFCKVCKVKVTDNIANVTQHIQGQMHKDNLNTIKSSVSSVVAPSMNGKTENYVENGFCKVCKVKVPNNISNIREHLKGEIHNGNVKKNSLNSIKNSINQQVNSSKNIAANTHTDKGMNPNLKTIASTPTNTDSFDTKLFYLCRLCNVKVPNTQYSIANHIKDANHIEHCGELSQDNKVISWVEETIDLLSQLRSSDKQYIHSVKPDEVNINNNSSNIISSSDVDFQDPYWCSICKVKVPNRTINIKEHVEGSNHKKNVINSIIINDSVNVEGGENVASMELQVGGNLEPQQRIKKKRTRTRRKNNRTTTE